MIVLYDSNVGKPVIRGEHHGTPRLWVVQVRATGMDDVVTFRPLAKVYIRDLADLIDDHLLGVIAETGKNISRVRWTATAR